jgi:hypothetical protein
MTLNGGRAHLLSNNELVTTLTELNAIFPPATSDVGDTEHVVYAGPDEVTPDRAEDRAREVERSDDVQWVRTHEHDVGCFDRITLESSSYDRTALPFPERNPKDEGLVVAYILHTVQERALSLARSH